MGCSFWNCSQLVAYIKVGVSRWCGCKTPTWTFSNLSQMYLIPCCLMLWKSWNHRSEMSFIFFLKREVLYPGMKKMFFLPKITRRNLSLCRCLAVAAVPPRTKPLCTAQPTSLLCFASAPTPYFGFSLFLGVAWEPLCVTTFCSYHPSSVPASFVVIISHFDFLPQHSL